MNRVSTARGGSQQLEVEVGLGFRVSGLGFRAGFGFGAQVSSPKEGFRRMRVMSKNPKP